ncbi:MBL fold metallo-hydrolase [Hamadaea tsunoensis]|uniref:MBL fold metallo-hydrolase n=1 Tax=Hamadaea tsunoensis TaxID=53368 RepID=UPI000413E198|nr:MBL fold metallo-hydrolase [Hamadaea tsunoensis]
MHLIDLGRVTATPVQYFENWPLPPTEFFPGIDSGLFAAHADRLVPDHWDPAADRVHIVVRSWLLRGGGRTVLIDTGLAGHGDLPAALAAAGTAAAEVDVVICTHLHADHVGGNTREAAGGGRVPAFPNATYLFAAADLEFFHPDRLVEQPGRSAAVYAASVQPVLDAGQAVAWTGEYAVDGDLRLVAAPGHTPGHAVVRVEAGGRAAVFAGDLMHSPVQVLSPGTSSCFCHDPAQAARSRREVLRWAADRGALVIPAHFGGAGAVGVQANGPGFRIGD